MSDRHTTTRVRHELRRRMLTVKTVERITPAMVRVVLSGGDLDGFVSAGFDDHVKLFFHAVAGADTEGAPAPLMRDFTPRSYNAESNELSIDFALHDTGPANDWASQAAPGHTLAVGGPRGSFIIPDDFDWRLLAGDESALPAIARCLEELRPGVPTIVVATVSGPEERLAFETRADLTVHWIYRPLTQAANPAPLLDAIAALTLPEGDGHCWVAGESATAKAMRQHLVGTRGLNKSWVKAAGYWRYGAAAIHDVHDD